MLCVHAVPDCTDRLGGCLDAFQLMVRMPTTLQIRGTRLFLPHSLRPRDLSQRQVVPGVPSIQLCVAWMVLSSTRWLLTSQQMERLASYDVSRMSSAEVAASELAK